LPRIFFTTALGGDERQHSDAAAAAVHRRRSDWNSGGTHGGTYYKSPAVEAKTHFPTL